MKKCPYCAEQIQDDAIKCRYCGSMLNGAPAPATSGSSPFDPDVRQLLAQGQKIAAIKLVRERTHAGLLEAKNYVEALERGGQPAMPVAAPASVPSIGSPGRSVIIWISILCALAGLWFAISHQLHTP